MAPPERVDGQWWRPGGVVPDACWPGMDPRWRPKAGGLRRRTWRSAAQRTPVRTASFGRHHRDAGRAGRVGEAEGDPSSLGRAVRRL